MAIPVRLLSDDKVMVASVHIEGTSFSADPPQQVRAFGDHIDAFAMAKSGRFVILRTIDPGKAPLSVVLNWQHLLEKADR